MLRDKRVLAVSMGDTHTVVLGREVFNVKSGREFELGEIEEST